MAAGRLVYTGFMPAIDPDGIPYPDAKFTVYQNRTTTLAVVYADEALTTPLANPILADSSGQFPPVWADDANLYSASISSQAQPLAATIDDLAPSTSVGGSADKLDRDGGNPEPDFLTNVGAAAVTGANIAPTTDAPAFRRKLNIQQVWPEDYGAVGDGTTNDAAALQAAINQACATNRPLMLTKYYRCNASLTATNSNLTIQGMGPTLSRIIFPPESQLYYLGISNDYGGTQIVMDGISFRMDGVSTKSVVKIEYTASGLGRETQHATITNLDIRGTTTAGGFLAGIECINVQNSDFSNIYVSGDKASVTYPVPPSTAPMTLPTSGAGISFAGSDNPTDIRVRACVLDFCYAGIKIRGPVEGVYVSQFTTVGTVIGIDDSPGATTSEPLLAVSDSHFNCYWRSISMVNRVQSSITNCLLYGFFGANISGANYTGIYIENNYILPATTVLSGNCISYQKSDRVSNPGVIGIDVGGTTDNNVLITGNILYAPDDVFDIGINLQPSCNLAVVEDDNIFINVTTPVINAAGSANTVKQSLRADGAGSVFLQPTANGYAVNNFFTPTVLPDGNGTRQSGGTSNRWSLVAAVNGDYSGSITTGGIVSTSGGFTANTGTFYAGQGSSGVVRAMMRIDTTDRIHIGEGSSEIIAYKTFVPGATNLNLGDSRRWSGIFLVNAPDVSSDQRQKTDRECPPELLKEIGGLSMRFYSRKDDETNRIRCGAYAQEVIACFDRAGVDWHEWDVVREDENGEYSIVYDHLLALKIAALEAK